MPPLILAVLPILVKLVLITHIFNPDPVVTYAGVQSEYVRLIHGEPTIDPNIGFTAHALGHLAAEDLLHGRMPWWNPYEGIGAPLAGEMQSAALLPLNLLLHFKNGQLFMHLAFQIIAGFATYALLRRLGAGAMAALIGGILFEFNGTFGWLANAVINPIPFLPLTLIGVEKAREHASLMRIGGWGLISVGIALSLYAGFPEVAYLDGLLIALWTLTRAPGLSRPKAIYFIAATGLGLSIGLLLSAPILIAFFDYLPFAYVGYHTGDAFRLYHLGADHFLNLQFPYLFGLIFDGAIPENSGFWGRVGGYAGLALICAAAVGLYGSRLRGLRIVLGAWIALCWAATYGIQPAADALTAIPGVALSAFFRYLPPSWEFALAILAGLAIDDLANTAQNEPRRQITIGVLSTGAILLLGVALATGQIARAASVISDIFWHSTAFGAAIFLCLLALSFLRINARSCAAALGCLACFEAVAYFIVPITSYPVHSKLELGAVAFLQSHSGLQRFYTLGPISPNYGSYFGIAELDHNDLPLPKDWVSFVQARLDDNATGELFIGESQRKRPDGSTALANLILNQESYRKLGVKYVVAEAARPVPLGGEADSKSLNAQLVYSDALIKIYELANPAPYFSADHCEIQAQSRERAEAKCDAASKLTRLELYMPGWTARINGKAAPVSRVDDLVQSVDLPEGVTTIWFRFEPPYMTIGYGMFALAIAVLGVHAIRRPSRRPNSL